MKFHYYPETDSLYIDLSSKPGSRSEEITDGVVLDFDDQDRLVGIDIDRAGRIVDLSRIEVAALPVQELSGTKS